MKRSIRIAVVVATTSAMMGAAALAVVGIGAAVSAHGGDTTIVADAAVVPTADAPVSSPVELTPAAPSDFRVPAIDKALRVVSEHVAASTAPSAAAADTSASTSASTPAPAATTASRDDSSEHEHDAEHDEHEGEDD